MRIFASLLFRQLLSINTRILPRDVTAHKALNLGLSRRVVCKNSLMPSYKYDMDLANIFTRVERFAANSKNLILFSIIQCVSIQLSQSVRLSDCHHSQGSIAARSQ